MNHGVVLGVGGDLIESRIWDLARRQGQSVAVYSSKYRCESALWRATYVPPAGEPPRFSVTSDPDGYYQEYARFEPGYDDQFIKLCRSTDRWPTVVVPSITDDAEAMRLLSEANAVSPRVWEIWLDVLHKKPEKGGGRFRDLFRPIALRDGWAYFLNFLDPSLPENVFLGNDRDTVAALVEAANADRYHYTVFEHW
jgi:hypothetical protein